MDFSVNMVFHNRRVLELRGSEGLETIIGKGKPTGSNLLFEDDDLFEQHAKLVVKRLFPADADTSVPPNFDSFRVYLESLGDADRIVDLESADCNKDARIIDLKDGDRFGLMRLNEPVVEGQQRPAKLKLLLNLDIGSEPDLYRLTLTDVTYESSPCASRSSNFLDSFVKEETEESDMDADMMDQKMADWNQDTQMHPLDPDDIDDVGVEPTAPNVVIVDPPVENNFGSFLHKIESYVPPKDYVVLLDSDEDDCTRITRSKPTEKRYRKNRLRTSKFKVHKSVTIRDDVPLKNDKKKKFDIYSGSLGFVIGSLGTLGILTAVANMVEP